MTPYIVAFAFFFLAVVHSVLGERALLRPLFAADWALPIPRWAAERIFRFAWHLTSVAWLGLGALALGVMPSWILFGVALSSGAAIFVMLRGHLAWPLFLVAAVAAAFEAGFVGGLSVQLAIASTVVVVSVIAAVHFYWVMGGTVALDAVVPTTNTDHPTFHPPRLATLAVATGLLVLATSLALRLLGIDVPGRDVLIIAAAIVFGLRAVGDGRYVGFSKRNHETRFARLDDRLYTPLSVLMCLGSVAAVL